MGKYGLSKIFAEVIDRMDLPNAQGFEDFTGSIAHAPPPCERNLGARCQLDFGEVGLHFRAVFAVDGTRKCVCPVLSTKSSEGIVGAHHTCVAAKPNDALSIRPLEQFVVDEPDAFVQTSAQQLGVVRLKLVGVREEEVGLVLDELVNGNFLDAKEHVAIAEVFVYLDPRGCVLFVCDTTNGTGLNHQFYIGKPL